MKRIGHLMERMLTEENFIRAERLLSKNKPKNQRARHYSQNAERYGRELFEKVRSGRYRWHKPREKTIRDSYNAKERHLKIPCLEDQAVQLAWLNIAAAYIERKNYYYNTGSIPGAGQTRAVKGVKKFVRDKGRKYAAVLDIRKFYETCPHWAIRQGLERIFKDRAFVEFAMGFVRSMSPTGTGIAIGYPVSHWLANVALMQMDHYIAQTYTDVKFVRYMDDMVLVSANKRHIRNAVKDVRRFVEGRMMRLKKWQIFDFRQHGIRFLSYRFYKTHALLRKRLMYRIASRVRRASRHMTAHAASGVISYLGILRYCNSYNFRRKFVYPYIRASTCRRLISRQARLAKA